MLLYSGFGILLVLSLWKNFCIIFSRPSASSYSRTLWTWHFIIKDVSIGNNMLGCLMAFHRAF